MILVSFSSVGDALINGVQKYDTFSSQGNENPPFRFFFFWGGEHPVYEPPAYLGYWLPLFLQKHKIFLVVSGYLPETIYAPNIPPFPR